MGYSSTIANFEQSAFRLPTEITAEDVLGIVQAENRDHAEYLRYWFSICVEDGVLQILAQGEGRAYELPEAVATLIRVLYPLQIEAEDDLRGLRLRFELWGEEPGDVTLYTSNGEDLFSVEGRIAFIGDPRKV